MSERSFRELDGLAGTPKGSAFRCFKAIAPELAEHRDYRLLRPDTDAAEIARLRQDGRIYASSVNVVLLAPATAERILAMLRGPA